LVTDFKQPATEIRDVDGIAAYGCKNYFVSLIDDSRLWRIDADGSSQAISALSIDAIDIQFHEGILYAPTVGGGLSVFAVDADACQRSENE